MKTLKKYLNYNIMSITISMERALQHVNITNVHEYSPNKGEEFKVIKLLPNGTHILMASLDTGRLVDVSLSTFFRGCIDVFTDAAQSGDDIVVPEVVRIASICDRLCRSGEPVYPLPAYNEFERLLCEVESHRDFYHDPSLWEELRMGGVKPNHNFKPKKSIGFKIIK